MSRIIGGTPVDSCAWPSAALLYGKSGSGGFICTASLVHPEIMITAGHCNDGLVGAAFTESMDSIMSADDFLKFEYCKSHPSWTGSNLDQHVDFAYCKLAEPVTDVEITPILMGCEVEHLTPDTTVTPVGFGKTNASDNMSSGTKYEVDTKFTGYSGSGEAMVGINGKGLCNGDSGGPVYVNLPEDKYGKDAGWRVFGVTSWGPSGTSCSGPARYGMMHTFVDFVESDSGIDITPCTDADGEWEPGPGCTGAPLDPRAATGDWDSGCTPGPAGGVITSCGDGLEDSEDPEVSITSPDDDATFKVGTDVEVTVEATDDIGVKEVVLRVNGNDLDADDESPFEWTLEDLDEGEYELEAVAVDAAGNEGSSKKVVFTVEAENEDDDTSEDDDDSTSDDDEDDDDNSDGSEGSTSEDDEDSTSVDDEDESSTNDGDDDKDDDKSDDDDNESDDDDDDKSSPKSNGGSGGGGCSVGASPEGSAAWLLALGIPALLLRRRRSSRIG